MSRTTGWCATLYTNTTGNEDEKIQALQSTLAAVCENNRVTFGVGQVERCPTSGRLHLQCYLVTTTKLRLVTVKSFFGDSAPHLEARRGTHNEAVAYCTKEETRVAGPWTFGQAPAGQGFRSDLASVAQDIENGALTQSNIREEAPSTFCRNRNGILDLLAHAAKKRTRDFRHVVVDIYYGEAGAGKTRKAHEDFPEAYTLETSACGNNIWFDGYTGEKVIIVDDFYGWIRFNFLLKFLDGYQLRLPIKGGHTWAEYDHVIFTSNSHPVTWYGWGDKISWAAFKRRVSKVILFKNNTQQELELPDDWMTVENDLSF